jgi:uncharacterized protein YndB with AHSA1/START domain
MTGEIHEFDARVGGGYRMSLFYPADERSFRCKTSDNEDMVNVRFLELAPPRRIVEAVSFVTTDPAFFGEMTMIATFEEVSGGTEVTVVFKNLPPGLRAADNEAGSRLSLEQLARRFECEDGGSAWRRPKRRAQLGVFPRAAANLRPTFDPAPPPVSGGRNSPFKPRSLRTA